MLGATLSALILLACSSAAEDTKATGPLIEFSKTARSAKVFTYDLAAAGLQPSLTSFAPGSAVCTSCETQNRKSYEGTDLCNFGYGKPEATTAATALHGVVWTNKDGGYSLAQHIHWRTINSDRRAASPADANLFFIPAYVPHLCRAKKYDPMVPCGVDFPAHQDFTALWRWLLQQESFLKSDGSDHFIILAKPWYSITQYCKLFKLTNATAAEVAVLRPKFDKMMKLVWEKNAPGSNVFPVPHSTSFHFVPSALPEPLAGALKLPASAQWQPQLLLAHSRQIFSSYVGSSARGSKFQTPYWDVKRHTSALCQADDACLAYLFDSKEESTERLRKWPGLEEHARILGFQNIQEYMDLVSRHTEFIYLMSTFCFTPPGDAATRRGLFDALLLGCIPVVFYRQSVDFPWHLPKHQLKKLVVYVPQHVPVSNGTAVTELLRGIPPMEVADMQQSIVRLLPQLQYSLSDMSAADHDRMGGDAWDVTLGHMMRLVSRQSKVA